MLEQFTQINLRMYLCSDDRVFRKRRSMYISAIELHNIQVIYEELVIANR
jgi:hypothetical protein